MNISKSCFAYHISTTYISYSCPHSSVFTGGLVTTLNDMIQRSVASHFLKKTRSSPPFLQKLTKIFSRDSLRNCVRFLPHARDPPPSLLRPLLLPPPLPFGNETRSIYTAAGILVLFMYLHN